MTEVTTMNSDAFKKKIQAYVPASWSLYIIHGCSVYCKKQAFEIELQVRNTLASAKSITN